MASLGIPIKCACKSWKGLAQDAKHDFGRRKGNRPMEYAMDDMTHPGKTRDSTVLTLTVLVGMHFASTGLVRLSFSSANDRFRSNDHAKKIQFPC
jgi:hypothetical protein